MNLLNNIFRFNLDGLLIDNEPFNIKYVGEEGELIKIENYLFESKAFYKLK